MKATSLSTPSFGLVVPSTAHEGVISRVEFAALVRSRYLASGAGAPPSHILRISLEQSHQLHDGMLRELQYGEILDIKILDKEILPRNSELLRRACTPTGHSIELALAARGWRPHAPPADTVNIDLSRSFDDCVYAICLNDFGTEPVHLAGRCWPNGDLSQPHPSYRHQFGASVSAMIEGKTDTLLVRAARFGRERSISLLIECGARIEQTNGYGDSPAFAACIASEVGALRVLHQAGADLSFVHEMTGLSCLQVAVHDFDESRRKESERFGGGRIRIETAEAKYTAQLAVMRYLLDVANVAEWEERSPIYEMLLDNSAGLGTSAPRREQVRLLLAHGFDPNIQFECSSSWCPWAVAPPICSVLHMACFAARHCQSQFDDEYVMVRLLVEGNGDPNILSSQSESPLMFARRKNLRWMVKLLQSSSEFSLPHVGQMVTIHRDPHNQAAVAGSNGWQRWIWPDLQECTRSVKSLPLQQPGTTDLEALWDGPWAAYRHTRGLNDAQFALYCQKHGIVPFERWKDEVRANIGPSIALQKPASHAAGDTSPGADTRVGLAIASAPDDAIAPTVESVVDNVIEPTVEPVADYARRDTPMRTRAEMAGVANRLQAMPESPALESGADAIAEHKLAKRAVQKANERRVARAESRLRSMR